MKAKYFKSGWLLALVAVLFAACDSDRDDNPTIGQGNAPTEFVLNTPAMTEQFIQLSESNKVNLTWSQPNYVYNAIPTYRIQVGIVDNGTVKWYVDENGNPKYLDTSFNVCNVNVSGEEIAEALCKIDGFGAPEDYVDMGTREIAVRVRATIDDATGKELPGTEIVSNTITFKHMAAYNAVKGLTCVWIIGNCSGWKEPSAGNAEALADWAVWETAIGSKVYEGTFEMPDYTDAAEGDKLTFRFYTKLTGWDADSYGTQVDDSPIDGAIGSGSFTGKFVKGKGSWRFNDFTTGKMKITIDMEASTVKFEVIND